MNSHRSKSPQEQCRAWVALNTVEIHAGTGWPGRGLEQPVDE
jgi:hypothetical protein